jgi:hypothetical protein
VNPRPKLLAGTVCLRAGPTTIRRIPPSRSTQTSEIGKIRVEVNAVSQCPIVSLDTIATVQNTSATTAPAAKLRPMNVFLSTIQLGTFARSLIVGHPTDKSLVSAMGGKQTFDGIASPDGITG